MPEAHAANHVREGHDLLADAGRRAIAAGRHHLLGDRREQREPEPGGLAAELGRALGDFVELTRVLRVLDRVDPLAEADHEGVEPRERFVVEEQGADGSVGIVFHAGRIGRRLGHLYDARMPSSRRPSNWAVLFQYVLPYFAYVGVLSFPESVLPKPVAYAVATVACIAALAYGWRWYLPLRGPGSPAVSVLVGIAAGVFGTALWVAIKSPFYEPGGEAWAPAAFWARVVASSTVVPVFEELLFRGLLLLGAVQWDHRRRAGSKDPLGDALHDHSVLELPPGAWTPAAVAISTLAFAAGHAPGEWPAAIAYGLLMAGLWIGRKDLLSCVIAHATTNLTLGLWVLRSGQWTVW